MPDGNLVSDAPKSKGPPTLDWYAVPWHVAEGPAQVRHKDGWLVCEVPADSYAALIAASPDILKALDELVDSLDSGYVPDGDGLILKEARAALAKAGAPYLLRETR